MEFDFEEIDTILDRHRRRKTSIIAILQDAQDKINFLPQDLLKYIAERLELPLSQVYGIATFYRSFSLKPRGKYLINLCLGTACHVRGAQRVLEEIKRRLKIDAGETTPDLKFSLETLNCVGACALGPVVIINGEYYGKMNSSKVRSVLKKYMK